MAVHCQPAPADQRVHLPRRHLHQPGQVVSIFERFERSASSATRTCRASSWRGPDFYSPDELDYKFEPDRREGDHNVGSVGQPRDRDPRSSFVVVNETAVEFIRLAVRRARTVKKVEEIEDLDDFLGSRLLDGR
jgi:hypothetical protein